MEGCSLKNMIHVTRTSQCAGVLTDSDQIQVFCSLSAMLRAQLDSFWQMLKPPSMIPLSSPSKDDKNVIPRVLFRLLMQHAPSPALGVMANLFLLFDLSYKLKFVTCFGLKTVVLTTNECII